MAKHKVLMIGAGGMARVWIRMFLPAFANQCEVVGLVDIHPEVLEEQRQFLGLDKRYIYEAVSDAIAAVRQHEIEPAAAIIVVPPHVHMETIIACAEVGLHILCEKPIANTWAHALACYNSVVRHRVKCQIVQNYRYLPAIVHARHILRQGDLGTINYLMARFAADYRIRDTWGAPFRHEIQHPLLIEGAVHHIDQIRNLSGADIRTVIGRDWRPSFAEDSFDGECCALLMMELSSGATAIYEGSCVSAGEICDWTNEQYRIECQHGTMTITGTKIIVTQRRENRENREVYEVPERGHGHLGVINQFLQWLDGGPAPRETIADNVYTTAALWGAIEASVKGGVVDVQGMMADLERS